MKTYLVGGSVRDRLLGVSARDTDYLVTDATEEDMTARGLVKVGQTFPVFIDPTTGDEFTLAHTLEEDLLRRDLTINALALDEEGNLIDLFGGEKDLREKNFRHVRPENFFEDPLRILRVARFRSQLPEFQIAPETIALMKEVAMTDAYKKILSERIIKELKRVFETEKPSNFFKILSEIHGLEIHFPGIHFETIDQTPVKENLRFAVLFTGANLATLEEWKVRLNIQNDWYESARAWILFQERGDLLDFFYRIDAFRKPHLIAELEVLDSFARGLVLKKFALVSEVSIRDIAPGITGKAITEAIREERRKRIERI